MTTPNTAPASDVGGLSSEDRDWLERTLKRGLPVGHCGESTSEAISRGRAEDRVDRVLAALSTPPAAAPAPPVQEATVWQIGRAVPMFETKPERVDYWRACGETIIPLAPVAEHPASGEDVEGLREALDWLALEAANLERSGARSYSGSGVDAALANSGARLDRQRAERYRTILAALIPKGG